jgi:alpha-ribazole phosphatase/probable phosphoglycerate mutase
MTLVDLIRHGMPVGGRRYRGHIDDPLSDDGWQQMWNAVGDAAPWDAIVTSPLRRCADFAHALGDLCGSPVEVDDSITEISFGDWEGRHVQDILDEDPSQVERYWQDPVANTPPGGESLSAFRDRCVAAWQRIGERHRGGHVLVVAHGGLIRTLMTHVLEMPLSAVLRLEVPNAGLTRVRLQDDINGNPAPSLVFHARERLT